MFRNKNVIYIIALLAVVFAIFFISKGNKQPALVSSPLVLASPSPSLGVQPSPSPRPRTTSLPAATLTPEQIQQQIKDWEKKMNGGFDLPTADYSKLKGPAVCQLSGSLDFYNHDQAVASDYFTYTGADSGADQITWKIAPNDKFEISPNMGASLPGLPDGKAITTVVLPPNPVAKHYVLTASMSYGRLANDGIRTYEAQCSGQVQINLNY